MQVAEANPNEGDPRGDNPEAPASTASVLVFAVLSALLTAGYGVLFSIVGDYRDDYGISEATVGWIIGIGFIVAFVAQIGLGPFGDRGYAKAMVFGGAMLNIAGLLIMGFGTTAQTLILGRVIMGLAVGISTPAIKRIVVLGSGDNLGRNLGWLLSADVFGFAVGPVISAVLVGSFGIASPFVVLAVLSAVVIAVVARLAIDVPEGEPDQLQRFAVDLLRSRGFAGAVMIGAAAFLMIGAFDALWDVVHSDLDTPEWVANLGIALFAIPLVVLGPIAGKLAQVRGPFLVGSLGLIAAAIWMASYGLMASGIAIFWLTMVHALTDGLSFAASGVAVGLTAPVERQSGAHGVLGAMQALAAGIMAPITGWLYGEYGQATAYITAAIVIVTMVAAGLVVAGPARTLTG